MSVNLNSITKNLNGDGDKGKYLTFYVGNDIFAIDIKKIVEIIRYDGVKEQVKTNDFKKGILIFGNEKVSFFKLDKIFFNTEKPFNDQTCFVITKGKDSKIGFVVDSVLEVTDFGNEAIMSPSIAARRHIDSFVVGVVRHNERIVQVLDISKILR